MSERLPPTAPSRAGDTATAAADNPVSITLAAAVGIRHVIGAVIASYDGGPTGGTLTITDGGTTVFQIDITAEDVHEIDFLPAKRFSENSEVVVTLSAGGAGVTGKLNITRWAV